MPIKEMGHEEEVEETAELGCRATGRASAPSESEENKTDPTEPKGDDTKVSLLVAPCNKKQQPEEVVDMLLSLGTMERELSQRNRVASIAETPTKAATKPLTANHDNGVAVGKEQIRADIRAFQQGKRPFRGPFNNPHGADTDTDEPAAPDSQARESLESLVGAFPVQGIGAPANSQGVEASLEFGVATEEASQQRPRLSNTQAFHASLVPSQMALMEDEEMEKRQQEVVDAIPMPSNTADEEPKWELTKSKRFNIGCLLLIVGIFLAVLLGLVLKPKDTKANDLVSPASAADNQTQVIIYPPFSETLWASSKRFIAEGPTSPAFKANAWMMEDPYLDSYPLWRQMQRFALAVKYFSMQGDFWFHKDHWLSYKVSECEW